MTELNILEKVKALHSFKLEAERELEKYRKNTLAQQAQIGEINLVRSKAYENAAQILADEIDYLTETSDNLYIENSGLRVQLGSRFDEKALKDYMEEKKIKMGINIDRNVRIMKRLEQRMLASAKQLANIPAIDNKK